LTRLSTAALDIVPADFTVAGARLVPDITGALYWPAEKTLVASDLHLEKGSWFARHGFVLPPYDTRTTLRRLADACARRRPRRVVALGDSFHDNDASGRLDRRDAQLLAQLIEAHDWIWILGNHDAEPPHGFGGRVETELDLAPLTFRHEPLGLPVAGEVAGHLHPCAKVAARGRRLRRRCFVCDGRRLVLPAMGAFAGGLNVLDTAFRPHIQDDFTVWVLGRERVYPIAPDQLLPDV